MIGKVLKPLALAGAACAACCVLPSRAAAQMQPTRSTVVDPAAVSDSEVATTPAPSNEGAPRVAVAAGVPAPAMTSADQPVARRPYAAPVVEVKPGVVWTYGSRDYAGRTWLIVPGGWYPPVWEDPCGRRRTNVIKGHAKWPGLRVDSNSDEVVVYPYPPRAVEVRYR